MSTIATSSTKEGIINLINKYFYSSTIRLHKENDMLYSVHNSKGRLNNYMVHETSKGFKFKEI